MSENQRVVRAAGLVAAVTLLSRFLGMFRDVAIAHAFGATAAADAFWVALRIPNTLRRLLGEGTLTVAMVPVLREARSRDGDARALRIARITWSFFLVVVLAVGIAGTVAAPLVVRVLALGFVRDPERLALATQLLHVTFPYLVFIGLVGLLQGVLNAFDRFFLPAFHPILYNLALLTGALVMSRWFDPPILGLAWSVILAGVLQLAAHGPVLRAIGFDVRPRFERGVPEVGKILGLLGPATFGIAIYQANVFMGTLLASWLVPGAISWLHYADRVFQLPLGLFVIALSTAMLPTLSSQAHEGRSKDLHDTTETAVRVILFLTVPSAIALWVLATPIVSVIFRRGVFLAHDVVMTARALELYALGLVPIAAGRILTQVFYSSQDPRAPARIAAVAFAVNLIGSLALMPLLGHGGLSLATSISAWAQLVITYRVLRGRWLRDLDSRGLALASSRMVLACVPMVLWTRWITARFDWLAPGSALVALTWLTIAVGGGLVLYLAAQSLLRSPELTALTEGVRLKRAGVTSPERIRWDSPTDA